jgi:AbiV family abortive infection protein
MALLEAGRFSSAAMMVILAQEEFGKAVSLGIFAVIEDPQKCRKLWKAVYEDHKQKSVQSLLVGVVTGRLRGAEEVAMPLGKRATEFRLIRERATYVDCVVGPEAWSLPAAVIGRGESMELAEDVFAAMRQYPMPSRAVGLIAEVWVKALKGAGHGAPVDEREIVRGTEAVEWARSAIAQRLDSVDRAEGTLWNGEMRRRLMALKGG